MIALNRLQEPDKIKLDWNCVKKNMWRYENGWWTTNELEHNKVAPMTRRTNSKGKKEVREVEEYAQRIFMNIIVK